MSDFDYETLLNRARDNIPEDISSRERWRLPEPQIMIEGSNTILRNFTEVVGMMDRDDNHVTDAGNLAARTAKHLDALHPSGARVIGNI